MQMSSVAGILLAAGLSRRYGPANKLLAPFKGVPLVLHAARKVRQLPLCRHMAVCGNDEQLQALLEAEGYEVAINPEPQSGMSGSLATGIGAIIGADAALVCLGDMPLVAPAHLEAILTNLTSGGIVASAAEDGLRCPPAAFSREHFGALLATTGGAGGRSLIADARLVSAPATQLRDFDTPADFLRAF